MKIIDTHCHLFLPEYKDLPQVLSRASTAGVCAMVNVGLDVKTSIYAVEQANLYKEIYACVGWHPHEALKFELSSLQKLDDLVKNPKTLAIGEVGLDYYRNYAPKDKQQYMFEACLDFASNKNLPVVIHTREAFEDTYAILSKYNLNKAGIIHCFTGSWAEAKKFLDLGFYLSFPGVITFPKAGYLREVSAKVPADRILIETDGPYLAPTAFRGKRNEPSYLVYHLEALAEARNITFEQAANLTYENSCRAFNFGHEF